MASAFAKLKNYGKRTIGYPEDPVPVVSINHWVGNLSQDPKRDFLNYAESLFPIFGWITRYNLGWLYGDVVAGLTVGIVVVPQSMSYAQIATLPPEYGLYSAFVGVLIYCLFATSKDVSIGPVAVMSLTVSQIIARVNKEHPDVWGGPQIATTVAFISGFIVLCIGLLRLGWIVEFIPAPAVSGFMTGSAINIVAGQVAGLMGETGFDTRAATYKVIINSLKFLPKTQLDAAFGLTGLVCLYLIRMTCDWLGKRYPRQKRLWFFVSTFRNAFVIIVLTIASWLFCRHRVSKSGKYPIKILETVPRGFRHVGPPVIDSQLVSALASELPVATIILLLEHIAISKSFGRVNNYKINPNQELIAIGVTNTIGTVFGAYPATGSFSRSALKSKSGVRTPAAGILTAIVVIVALYGLTPAFFWIPSAGLSAIIIHAVADLVAKPKQAFAFWRVSPLEFLIWSAAVLVTVFSTIEDGIYTSICASMALLLVRLARPRGYFMGKITLRSSGQQGTPESRDVYVPLNPKASLMNSGVTVNPPPPGVVVYRFEESFLYPNSSLLNSTIVDHVKANMKRGKDMSTISNRDRPWNDPGPRPGHDEGAENAKKPVLRAIVLDFSAVSQIDTTAVQALIDTRDEVERWADHPVEFHFATVLSPWIRRALIAGDFGIGGSSFHRTTELAQVGAYSGARNSAPSVREKASDLEGGPIAQELRSQASKSTVDPPNPQYEDAPISLEETPFFHFDIVSAVRAAESDFRRINTTGSELSEGSGKRPISTAVESSSRENEVERLRAALKAFVDVEDQPRDESDDDEPILKPVAKATINGKEANDGADEQEVESAIQAGDATSEDEASPEAFWDSESSVWRCGECNWEIVDDLCQDCMHEYDNTWEGIVDTADDALLEESKGRQMEETDVWKIYLGRGLTLDKADDDGTIFMVELVQEAVIWDFPKFRSKDTRSRWETIQEVDRPGIWITRPEDPAKEKEAEDLYCGEDDEKSDYDSEADEDDDADDENNDGVADVGLDGPWGYTCFRNHYDYMDDLPGDEGMDTDDSDYRIHPCAGQSIPTALQ
ncbi:hypothetical protein PHLCEN_2v5033 [Hermanssonia centrifuga]|uniref:STAS domain-containing protein n=1 Tax=Hermanssonia centrifuga TaxID=98765 RepID=A0A2R6PC57_9APHY|nr:hypothetical protein PHLCEN_2v5033 [Hermanssonia centrifuga]